MAETQA